MIIKEVKPTISNFKIVGGAECWKEVVESARLSGVPVSVKDIDCFNMILENDYSSALEHISIKFTLLMSKGNSPEFLEHRMCSHSGFSTRYCKAGKDEVYEIIVPFHLLKDKEAKDIFMKGIEESFKAYETLINNKIPREIARYVLPFASATAKYWCTINLRSLINFIQLRLCVRASPELRSIASQLYFLLEDNLPIIKNKIGCRGFMMSACPEDSVTNVRKGEKLSCPFSNPNSKCFIPTRTQSEKMTKNILDINKVQKFLYKSWSNWK
jgi:thymidylate synthase (FAD)